MREIKCQAWDSVNKKMLSWNDIGWMEINQKLSTHTLLSGEYAHFTPRFYTGLKDKNGKEIYEGDIDSEFDDGYRYVVYKDGAYGLHYHDDKSSFDPFILWDQVEVIGNIYEHRQLLE